jgi:hypothetical protein
LVRAEAQQAGKPDLRQSNPGRQCHHKSTRSVWFMTLEGTTAHAAAFPPWCGVWEGFWAWSKSLLPLAASLRSGLRKTSVKAGDAGHVFSGCLASRFGSTRHGRPNNGAFSPCARSTRTPGREAFGHTGSVPAFRTGSITVGQRRVGWNSAKPDDTWPATRRRDNCRWQLLPNQVCNGRHSTIAGIADLGPRFAQDQSFQPGDRPLCHRALEIVTKSFAPLRAPQMPATFLRSRGGEGLFASHTSTWADCPFQNARQPGVRFVQWDAGKCLSIRPYDNCPNRQLRGFPPV